MLGAFRRASKLQNPIVGNTFKLNVIDFAINYSNRFRTRAARTQGIGQRGKKRAHLAQQKADWVKLGGPWHTSKLGPHLNSGPTWRNLGTSGGKLNMLGGIWRRSWAQGRPNVGNIASVNHLQSEKCGGNSGQNVSFHLSCWPILVPKCASNCYSPAPRALADAATVDQICSYPSLLNYHTSAPLVRADF